MPQAGDPGWEMTTRQISLSLFFTSEMLSIQTSRQKSLMIHLIRSRNAHTFRGDAIVGIAMRAVGRKLKLFLICSCINRRLEVIAGPSAAHA
jgi:hypothetical protein